MTDVGNKDAGKDDVIIAEIVKVDEHVSAVEKTVTTITTEISKNVKDITAYLKNISGVVDELQLSVKQLQAVQLSQAVRSMFTCKICSGLPQADSEGVFISTCCGQIVGCKKCVEQWFNTEIKCILCNNDEIGIKAVPFHACQEIIAML